MTKYGRTPHLKDEEFCDGIIHCPEKEDEDFEKCKDMKAFPKSANFTCESDLMDNVTILATKCNSIIECKDGIDEKDCDVPPLVLGLVLGSCLILSMISSAIALQCSRVKMVVLRELDIENSSDQDVEALVINSPKTCQRKEACWVLFNRKVAEHDGDKAKALNNLKVS